MATLGIPTKTAEGHAELAARYHGLTQRHRTLLLLIDGRRSLDDVLATAQRAGVPRAYIDDLVAMGLVEVPIFATHAPRDTVSMPPPVLPWEVSGPDSGRQALDSGARPEGLSSGISGLSQVDIPTELVDLPDEAEALPGRRAAEPQRQAFVPENPVIAKARGVLIQALREESGVKGSATLLRLRRARTRDDLVALLPEVQGRIGHQQSLFDGMALIREARRLLDAR